MHQMCFPKTGSSVKKERIINFTRRFCNSKCCGMGKFIVTAYDKGIEIIFRV